jgi:hypothetical protein
MWWCCGVTDGVCEKEMMSGRSVKICGDLVSELVLLIVIIKM